MTPPELGGLTRKSAAPTTDSLTPRISLPSLKYSSGIIIIIIIILTCESEKNAAAAKARDILAEQVTVAMSMSKRGVGGKRVKGWGAGGILSTRISNHKHSTKDALPTHTTYTHARALARTQLSTHTYMYKSL